MEEVEDEVAELQISKVLGFGSVDNICPCGRLEVAKG